MIPRHALSAGLVFLAATSAAVAEDAPPLQPRVRLRPHAGQALEMPGIVALGPFGVSTRGEIVANTGMLVAVKMRDDKTPVCLPRPRAALTGRLLESGDEAWTFAVDGQPAAFRIPRQTIVAVDVSRGRHRGKGALKGGAWGLLALGTIGVALGSYCEGQIGCPGRTATGLFLGATGAVLGAVIGSATASEHWESVRAAPPRVSLRPQVGRRAGVTIAVSL